MTPNRQPRLRWVAAGLAACWIGALVFAAVAATHRLQQRFGVESPARQLRHYLEHRPLKGQAAGRVNVLLLGVPGAGHNGPRMTDTLLLLSVFPRSRRATLLSIPRDLAIESPDGSTRKINEAYSLAAASSEKGVAAATTVAAATAVAAALGVAIHYGAVVDIAGLERIVDALGGISVWVDRAFQDLAFRDAGNPYSAFSAGWTHMNGERALVYARARRGTNGEGTDYARATRQQKVLVALRDRLSSPWVRLNPLAVWRFGAAVAWVLETDLQPWEMAALRRMLSGVELERLPSSVFTDVLEAAYEDDGIFRLRPRGGSFEPIRHRVRNLLDRPSVAERLVARAQECGSLLPEAQTVRPPIALPRWVWDLSGPIIDGGTSQRVRGIVIHHDGIRHSTDKSGAAKADALRRSLLRDYGWTELPYHYLIDVDGQVLEGAAESAATLTRTWHDPSDLLHVALLGNYSVDHPTESQMDSLLRLVAVKAREYDLPMSHVRLHGELVATACPGAHVRAFLQPVAELACLLANGATVAAPEEERPVPLRRAQRIEPRVE